jgi:hypothetical protein
VDRLHSLQIRSSQGAPVKTILYQFVCPDKDVNELLDAIDFGLASCQCEWLSSINERAATPHEITEFEDSYAAEPE